MYFFFNFPLIVSQNEHISEKVELIPNLTEQDHNVRKTQVEPYFCFPVFKIDHQSTT